MWVALHNYHISHLCNVINYFQTNSKYVCNFQKEKQNGIKGVVTSPPISISFRKAAQHQVFCYFSFLKPCHIQGYTFASEVNPVDPLVPCSALGHTTLPGGLNASL